MNSSYNKALNYGLRLILIRDRTVIEIKKKLLQKKYNQDVCEKVITKLSEWGYLNDELYVKKFLLSSNVKGKGKKKIYYMLKEKGLEDDIIENAFVKYYDQEIENTELEILASKKTIQLARRYTIKDIRHKLYNYLQRKGFENGAILNWINSYLEALLDNIEK